MVCDEETTPKKHLLQGTPAPLRAATGANITFTLLIACLGGVHAALIMMPSIRLARCVRLALHPPTWQIDQALAKTALPLETSAFSRVLAYLTVALPAACLLLWFKPIAGDLLGLSPGQSGMAQGLGLVTCGTLFPCMAAIHERLQSDAEAVPLRTHRQELPRYWAERTVSIMPCMAPRHGAFALYPPAQDSCGGGTY